jgi:hypothetical protein
MFSTKISNVCISIGGKIFIINFLFHRIDQTVKTVYFNRINSAIATTIDWHREPHNTIGTVMNTLAEDLQW